mmetsp:Transcript_14446/g.49352  ORF Transcript_14446/g.49352 Transcript_14446/m.49352 type:complete len:233 (-) Transcript_14446:1764-2462(-)
MDCSAKNTRALVAAKGSKSLVTSSIRSCVSPCCAIFSSTSWLSFLILSREAITVSSSRMLPLASERACSRAFSSWFSLSLYSPWSFSRSSRSCSTSGRSDLSTRLSVWSWSPAGVMVKLMRETRLNRSGLKWQEGSRVLRKRAKEGEKSMSWLPRRTRTLPPFLEISRLRMGLRMGSTRSTSVTRMGVPKRRALSRCFMKEASRNEVFMICRSLCSRMRKEVAWPEGSTTMG